MKSISRSEQLLGNVRDLNNLILEGRLLDAFDKYYADDVIMQENQTKPTVGKVANRKREREWLSNVTEFRNAEVKSIGVDPESDVTLVEWIFDYSHREWGDVRNHQVSVQRWRGDQIVHERFVYSQ